MASLNISKWDRSADLTDPAEQRKLSAYLYKLTEEIRYMFDNLTPEDNYSSEAYLKFVHSEDTQASMEISLEKIKFSYVPKDGVISSINLSEEGVRIKGRNIYMEGVITANNDANGNPTFSVDMEGHMHATSGTFSGNITASTITGSTFRLDRGANVGFLADGETFQLGDFIVNDWWGRQVLESTDETTGMSGEPGEEGGLFLWAGYYDEDDYRFVVNSSDAYVMYAGQAYPIGATLSRLSNMSYYDGEDPNEDPDPEEDEEEWDGSSPDGKPDPGYVDSGPGVGL